MATIGEPDSVASELTTALRHTLIYGAGSIIIKAAGFLMLPVYTHFLKPLDYGVLEILDLSMSLFGLLLNMGITSAMIRLYAAANSPREKRIVVSTAFVFVLASGSAVFIPVWATYREASAALMGPGIPSEYFLLSFTTLVLNYVVNVPRSYLRARESSAAFSVLDAGSVLLMLGLNVFFLAVLHIGVAGILWSSLIAAILQFLICSTWIVWTCGIGFRSPVLGALLKFGLPLIGSNLAMFTLNFADRFFLQRMRSLEEVGLYAVGYKFGYMMNYLLVQSFCMMWQTRMYGIYTRPDHPKVFGQIFMVYSLVLVYAGLALAVLSPELILVMAGRQFLSSHAVIPLVALSYVFYGLAEYVQTGLLINNRTTVLGTLCIAAAAVNLLLNVVMIGAYGMIGAASATALSFGGIALASYIFAQRVLPLPLDVIRVVKVLGVAVVFYLSSRWLTPLSLAMAVPAKLAVLALFPLALWKTPLLAAAERTMLTSIWQGPLSAIQRGSGLFRTRGWAER